MDRRLKKTRAAVFAAFESLLSEKRYEEITVQDIIDRADISRSTFYAHFEAKDMLLRAMCQDLFEHIFEEHPGAEGSHDYSSTDQVTDDRIAHILYHLRDDRERYSRLFSGESADLFWTYFREGFSRLSAPDGGGRSSCGHDVPSDLYLSCYCGAFIETVKWWFQNGLSVSPEVLTAYFDAITSPLK